MRECQAKHANPNQTPTPKTNAWRTRIVELRDGSLCPLGRGELHEPIPTTLNDVCPGHLARLRAERGAQRMSATPPSGLAGIEWRMRSPEPCAPSGPSSRRSRTGHPQRQYWHHLHRRRHRRARHRGHHACRRRRHRRHREWIPCRTGSCHALSCPCRSCQGANKELTLPFGGHHRGHRRGHRRGHQTSAASHGPYRRCLGCQNP